MNYHPHTGELLFESYATLSPLEPETILLPACATELKPPKTSFREIAVFKNHQWQIKADWRTAELFSTQDGSSIAISEIGKKPVDVEATEQAMPGPDYIWKNGAWQLDSAKRSALLAQLKSQALATVNQMHADTVQKLTGHPTQVEKDTWALKLEIAKAIDSKTALNAASQAFLDGAGITSSTEQIRWANSVLTKSGTYAQAIGLAEKLRDNARAAINNTDSETEIKKALFEQNQVIEIAIAEFLNQS